MAFDLHITFSGLCLFAREPGNPRGRVHVLMPPTKGHCQQHVVRLGYHSRYAVSHSTPTPPGKRFIEHELEGKWICLDSLDTDDLLNDDLGGTDVVNLSRFTSRPARAGKAISSVVLGHGSVCPQGLCERPRGARWRFRRAQRPSQAVAHAAEHMTTSVQWRIGNVTGGRDTAGKEVLALAIKDREGADHESVLLRPDERGQIRIYVFHTPEDELPSQGPLRFTAMCQGEKAEHFTSYYSLFDDDEDLEDLVLHFVDHGEEDEDDEADDEDDGEEELALYAAAEKKVEATARRPGGRKFMMINFGRRFECVVAQAGDVVP